MNLRSIKQIKALMGKRVLLRLDLDLPIGDDGKVDPGEDARLDASLPTIKYLLNKKVDLVIVGHMGRPGGQVAKELKLKPVVQRLAELLNIKTGIAEEKLGTFQSYMMLHQNQEIHILENIRFLPGEKLNSKVLAKDLGKLADVYVNDAFAVVHRNHASVSGVTKYLPSYAGLNLLKEVAVLGKVLKRPSRPLTLIVGGVKAHTKLKLVEKFLPRADYILLGSAVANNFYRHLDFKIGKSVYDKTLDPLVKSILDRPKYSIINKQSIKILLDPAQVADISAKTLRALRKRIILPFDVVTADLEKYKYKHDAKTVKIDPSNPEIADKYSSILDIGPKTSQLFQAIIKRSKTIIWNGPMGLFEQEPFDKGTHDIAKAVAASKGKGIIGGGDTIAAIGSDHITQKQNIYISSGGGAMLEFLLDPRLPGIKPLMIR